MRYQQIGLVRQLRGDKKILAGVDMNRTMSEVYRPTEDEEYMNRHQLDFFKKYLLLWRSELLASSVNFVRGLKEVESSGADFLDRSSTNTGMSIELETRCHQSRLLEQIEHALNKIAGGEYGYCEVTGEEIGLSRLMARPVATMCVEVQERYERLSHTASRQPMFG